MKFNEFLLFNHDCPICGEPLHLYMQWTGSKCFKAEFVDFSTIKFKQVLNLDNPYQEESGIETDDYVTLITREEESEMICSSSALMTKAKSSHIYFYYICNPQGIIKKNYEDYKISQYKACYYRSSTLTELKQKDLGETLFKSFYLNVVNPDFKDIINKHESYAFKSYNNNVEKVYVLNLDWESKETTLWFYSVSDVQKKEPNWKPNLFEKKMPLLNKRPEVGIEDRDKLLSRFESWILIS